MIAVETMNRVSLDKGRLQAQNNGLPDKPNLLYGLKLYQNLEAKKILVNLQQIIDCQSADQWIDKLDIITEKCKIIITHGRSLLMPG